MSTDHTGWKVVVFGFCFVFLPLLNLSSEDFSAGWAIEDGDFLVASLLTRSFAFCVLPVLSLLYPSWLPWLSQQGFRMGPHLVVSGTGASSQGSPPSALCLPSRHVCYRGSGTAARRPQTLDARSSGHTLAQEILHHCPGPGGISTCTASGVQSQGGTRRPG